MTSASTAHQDASAQARIKIVRSKRCEVLCAGFTFVYFSQLDNGYSTIFSGAKFITSSLCVYTNLCLEPEKLHRYTWLGNLEWPRNWHTYAQVSFLFNVQLDNGYCTMVSGHLTTGEISLLSCNCRRCSPIAPSWQLQYAARFVLEPVSTASITSANGPQTLLHIFRGFVFIT